MPLPPEHIENLTPPLVSAIVVNRNTADLLVACVDHIARSDLDGGVEIIVVDNGSSDDSVARIRQSHPDVTVLEAGKNLGFAAANNRAFAKARGDFLLLVNTDAMLEPGTAKELLRVMTAQPDAAMVGPQLTNPDGSAQTSYEAVPTLATETLNRSLLKRLFPAKYPSKHRHLAAPEPVEALIGAVMLLRRTALEGVDGFDEGYFFFLEETDLAVRFRAAGWKVVHDPLARVVHLQGATAKSYHAGARIEFYRSRYRFFSKHYGQLQTRILQTVLFANLTLNVLGLGLATLVTFGMVPGIRNNFLVRWELWKWHLQGCPAGPGLPRQ
jgi:GT2 family glycosyltransferase